MSKRAAEDTDSGESSKKVKHDDGESPVLQKDDEGNLYVDLGSLKRATVSIFRGKAYVNLREYYRDKTSGDVKPGKKGITLDSTQWASLVANIAPLTKQLELAESGGTSAKGAKAKEASKETKSEGKKEKPAKKKKKPSSSEVEDDDDE